MKTDMQSIPSSLSPSPPPPLPHSLCVMFSSFDYIFSFLKIVKTKQNVMNFFLGLGKKKKDVKTKFSITNRVCVRTVVVVVVDSALSL